MVTETYGADEIKKLGIKGELAKNFDTMPKENIYTEYYLDLPPKIIAFCEQVASVGGRALVVGGSVRDMIVSLSNGSDSKYEPKDIDIEVYGIKPADLVALAGTFFSLSRQKTNGKSFEVISVMGSEKHIGFDISTPRENSISGVNESGFEKGSRPDFTIVEATSRRDLTCNSILYDPIKRILYDPYKGLDDIKNKILRVSNFEKFSDDPVRIFRLIQLLSRLEGTVDPVTEEYCKSLFEQLKISNAQEQGKSSVNITRLNRDRVLNEYVKLFTKGKKPSLGLEFALRIGIVDFYFPTLAKLKGTIQEYRWHKEGDVWNHIMQAVDAAAEIADRDSLNDDDRLALILATLCHDLGKVNTTKRETMLRDGQAVEVITSRGHDLESVKLTDDFLNSLFGEENESMVDRTIGSLSVKESTSRREIRDKVKTLVRNHMHLRGYYGYYQKGVNTRRMMGRLARDLDKDGASIFLLNKLTEADQRARREKSSTPLATDEVYGLTGLLKWADSYEYTNLPKKILDGKKLIEELGLKPGVLVGTLVDWVFDDQMAGEVTTLADALEKANKYLVIASEGLDYIKENDLYVRQKSKKIMPKDFDDEVLVWMKNGEVKDMLIKRFL